MKGKKSFLTLLMACFVVVLFCLAGTAIGGPGPNPSIPADSKLIGPNLQGVIIAGWIETDPTYNFGTVEVFLLINDRLYTGIISTNFPETEFLESTPSGITQFALPDQIAIDYNMGEGAEALIFDEKDVSNLNVIDSVSLDITVGPLSPNYKHVLHCDVKISFLLPKK